MWHDIRKERDDESIEVHSAISLKSKLSLLIISLNIFKAIAKRTSNFVMARNKVFSWVT